MEIYILDRNINILGVLSTYDAIMWNPKLHEPGRFKASFLYSDELNVMLQRRNLLYKTDEDEPAVITRKYLKLNKSGEETIQVQGYMTSWYLHQRIIWKKMILSGTPEEIMREMVYKHVINPEDATRKMERIRLGELHGYTGDMQKQISYANLQEALTDISKVSGLGYRLRLDVKDRLFYFDVYKGVDRTFGSEEPCIFSRDFENVYMQEYEEDDSNYGNVCLVGGSGEDTDRLMETVGEAEGMDRYEIFYNASGISDTEISMSEYTQQLIQKALERLSKYPIVMSFENKINTNKAMAFALGDYVTCTDKKWGITVDVQIKEIEKGYAKDEMSCYVTFGDKTQTLIDLIKAKE